MAYLDDDTYLDLTILPAEYIAEVDVGWLNAQLAYWSAAIDARLRKRYAAPFAEPYPIVVTGWLARLVDVRVLLKRGVDATDAQFVDVSQSAKDALTEIKEAADAKDGLYDLPLRADTTATGIVAPTPGFYSELSPYTSGHVQRRDSENEP